jgi:AbrB family looped-hinge helix DNA binding protein
VPTTKIQRRRHIVIPQEIMHRLGLQEGDFVELEVVDDTIVVKPRILVDPRMIRSEYNTSPLKASDKS